MMPHKLKIKPHTLGRPSWRDYQAGLKTAATRKSRIKLIFKFSTLIFLILLVTYAIISGLDGQSFSHFMENHRNLSNPEKTDIPFKQATLNDKKNVRMLIKATSFINLKDKRIVILSNGRNLKIDTSLDVSLQNFLLKKLNTTTARYIGIVAMNPVTGNILAMVSFNKMDRSGNPCVGSRFPAASIFKIVTASAVIEKYGFGPNHVFTYNGMKHTLYKSQLKERRNRYTNRITFQDSFAESVNPVFGKIGEHYLGKSMLEKYAKAFGFNRNIDFEIPVVSSSIFLSDNPYQWAEVASGFNQETKISPLHGALIASAIINQGRLMEPTIVNQIVDEQGKIIYHGKPHALNRAISPGTSRVLNRLMATTIKSGTCRKTFSGYRRDRILSKLNIGGKTGTIDTESHDARYDWFVGFAEEKGGTGKIAISVLVAHEKYIGLRASYYARIAMKKYFDDYFTNNRDLETKKG